MLKRIFWVRNALECLKEFPRAVQISMGTALREAQEGGKALSAKPMKGLGGGILEIVEDFDGDTYRAVYTVRLSKGVYVLHAFQKKSKKGVKTPRMDIELIRRRLKDAIAMDEED